MGEHWGHRSANRAHGLNAGRGKAGRLLMSRTDPTIKDRAKRFNAKQAELGLVKVAVWVPVEDREDLRSVARKWRERHIGRMHTASRRH